MKKIIYLILWVVLGFILSFTVLGIFEMGYISWAVNHNASIIWTFNGLSVLPIWATILFSMLSLAVSIWCGLIAWQKIYVEKLRGNNPKFFSR